MTIIGIHCNMRTDVLRKGSTYQAILLITIASSNYSIVFNVPNLILYASAAGCRSKMFRGLDPSQIVQSVLTY